MINIENKTTSIPQVGGENLSYIDLIKIVANTPLPQGLTATEMKARLDIVSKCDEKSTEFSPSQIKELKSMTAQHRWGTVNKEIVEFSDYIASL